MSREEAIKTLKEHKILYQHDNGWDITTLKALDVAISALSENKAKSKVEYIDKIELVRNLNAWDCKAHGIPNYAWRVINEMPTYSIPNSAENKWISVSERLPEDYDRVLITVNGCRGLIVREAQYYKARNEFEVLHNHERWEVGEKGLFAWQPLPEPYQKGGE